MSAPNHVDSRSLQAALRLTRHNDRATILEVLKDFPAPPSSGALSDHLWVWAELNYRRGWFPRARIEFARWRTQSEGESPPAWMSFLCALRCAYSALRMGEGKNAGVELGRAEELRLHVKNFADFEPDIEAMHAHLLELGGSSELARARFVRAHSIAREHDLVRRAATIASDIGRLLVDLDRHADALEWQDRALGYMKGPYRDEFIERTIRVRLAKLEKMMGRVAVALEQLEDIRERCADGVTPKAHVNALVTLHDIRLLQENPTAAEALLVEGIAIAKDRGLRPNLVTLHRSLSRLLILQPETKQRAQEHYLIALRLAFELDPRPGLMLRHLAEDILEFRDLFRSSKSRQYPAYRQDLAQALKDFSQVQRPRQLGQHQRRRVRGNRAKDLAAILGDMIDKQEGVERLNGCQIRRLETGFHLDVAGISVPIQLSRARILKKMLSAKRGMTAREIADECRSTVYQVQGTFSWMRRNGAAGAVRTTRKGRHGQMFYRLVRADEPAKDRAPRTERHS